MSSSFRLVESTEPKFRLAPSTQAEMDGAAVARALGAEPVGPPSGFTGITFAALRARVAAVMARGPTGPPSGDPFDFGPPLRASIHKLTADLRADGLSSTPGAVTIALLEMSVEVAQTDRSGLVAKLREMAALAGGQPS
jgi:hypothetical protein